MINRSKRRCEMSANPIDAQIIRKLSKENQQLRDEVKKLRMQMTSDDVIHERFLAVEARLDTLERLEMENFTS
jgi:cell division protein FtsB